MKKIFKRIVSGFLIFSAVSMSACSSVQRSCAISYSYKSISTMEVANDIYVGNTYYLCVEYEIGNENSNGYSFTSYVNANDNIVISYIEGPNCTLSGNFIEVKYEGKSSAKYTSTYKIDVKSKGTSSIKFKDIYNLVLNYDELKLEAKEK